MSIDVVATNIAAIMWMALAVYAFVVVHKWDVKLKELYEMMLRDVEEQT